MTAISINVIVPSETMRVNNDYAKNPEPARGHSWVHPQVSTRVGSWIISDGKIQAHQLLPSTQQGFRHLESTQSQDTLFCKVFIFSSELFRASIYRQERGFLLSLNSRIARRNRDGQAPNHFSNSNFEQGKSDSDLANALAKQGNGQEVRETRNGFQDIEFMKQSIRKGIMPRLKRELWAEFPFGTLYKNRLFVTKNGSYLRVSK